MTMILKAKDIGMELQGKPLFEGIHLEVAEGERIALYGRNGMGKSTLLSILAGERQPTNGTVEAVLPRERWGWMRQQDEPDESEMTALEMVRSRSESSLWELKQQLAAIEKQMQATDADAMDRLVEQYGNLLERYESGGGFQWETEVEKAMTMLGIGPDVWPVPYKELSGGQKTKVMLGALLVRNPKFLLLDEPTNHLDSESLVWLEQWLVSSYKGTVLFVSHDREFIDRVATTVCELSATELRRYRGGYTDYRREKERELREQETLYRKQELARKALEESIRRYEEWFHKAHNSAGDGDVRITASYYKAKAKKNISRYHAKEKALERLEAERVDKPRSDPKLKMELEAENIGARTLLRVKEMSFGFGDRLLFDRFSFQLNRGDRLAVRGPNGSGKTTLLKLLLGEITPTEGTVAWHPAVKIGYFSQQLEGLEDDMTLLDSLLAIPGMTQSHARTLLGCFLFRRDDVFKQIGQLSMGEKCRTAFLKLYFSGAHLLVLDEPSNYLDVDTREVIEEVLVRFPGAIALVSHDRYLVRKVANRLLTLQPGGAPVWFEGSVAEEEEHMARVGVIRGDTDKENRRMELEYRIQELLGLSAGEGGAEQAEDWLAEIRTLRNELARLQGE
ncbi:ABC-F type ribosomal protection protein [Paenibacillus sp. FSL K6-1566]|uniref:ATP-binding cassette subfamily F protein 3 n=1 Tax=Paenibacillus lactis TaxID=228574 RepID=A0ABS4F7R4_9BACL|nr:ABC-F type ribosomal protection protein [Paenibacillus lactis]MBP1892300.1 ATP-binding cassette subfamily F protein 3 [Paenibacillus lactis]HAG01243.1 ABC-F type ribosomal protection protein [Paenibacillus lactis]